LYEKLNNVTILGKDNCIVGKPKHITLYGTLYVLDYCPFSSTNVYTKIPSWMAKIILFHLRK